MTAGRAAFAAGTVLLVACRHDVPPPETRELGAEIVARVGDDALPRDLVADVARAQERDARGALEVLVRDALLARGARESGLAQAPDVRHARRAALARAVIDRIARAARDAGPPTDAEIAALTERHWRAVARPAATRTIHAIVMRPKGADAAALARAAAERIRGAVASATSADEFEARAKSVVLDAGLELRVERLGAVAADGRVVEGEAQAFDRAFARAATALAAGETSPVVETSFGFHVIRATDKLAAAERPLEVRRVLFAEEVYAQRARAALEARVAALEAKLAPARAAEAESLVKLVLPGNTTP